MIERLWENLLGRLDGPMHFRVFMQPIMASIFALRSGIKDARAGVKPYLWKALTLPDHRRRLLRDGWKNVARVFFLAILLDLVYQLMVLKHVYPLETLVVAVCLALVPYAVLRGLFHRLALVLGVRPASSRITPPPSGSGEPAPSSVGTSPSLPLKKEPPRA